MSCEMISSRKIDYYVNDPYVTIIDIRLKEKFLHSRINAERFPMNLEKYSVIKIKYTYFIVIKVL